ncbi:hypothetical protein GCE9029_01221 [Grimontia celer]|uniref:Uncharacterized protein n=1 Tax=Grimontia celer TaxID=1796497 RepID=A0A128EWR4_9GAMM|nr:hypothetical protein GCE9029_01221 [Grimontia celer]
MIKFWLEARSYFEVKTSLKYVEYKVLILPNFTLG